MLQASCVNNMRAKVGTGDKNFREESEGSRSFKGGDATRNPWDIVM